MEHGIESKITNFIANEILKQPGRIITLDEPLLSSGLIDSFSLVDLAVFIEEEIGARIDDSELNSTVFDSLRQLIDIIESRIK